MSAFFNELLNNDCREFLFEVVILRNGATIHDKFLKKDVCQLCWNDLNNTYTFELKCGHLYHRKCMLDNIIINNKAGCEICKIIPNAPEA